MAITANPVGGRNIKSPDETTADAIKWASEHKSAADDAIHYLGKILEQAPVHSALLGDVGERFGIPKPVSAFFRAFCPDFRFLSAGDSPNGSPAVCLESKLFDDNYWNGFRKRGLDPASDQAAMNPWLAFGIDGATMPFNEVRVMIFEAFLMATYGAGNLRDMALVCADFKKFSGVSFSSFFGGLRPADLQAHPLASTRLNWAWSNTTPPTLSCAARVRYTPPAGDAISVRDNIVATLLDLVTLRMPDFINFDYIAEHNGTNVQSAMLSYLVALKQALQTKILHDEQRKEVFNRDALEQIYRRAKDAAEQARRALDAATSVIEAIERLGRSIAR